MRVIRNSTGMVLGIVGLAACGGSDSGTNPPPPPQLAVAKAPSASGDAQTGVAGSALADPIRVRVTEDGTPKAGVSVTFAAAGTGAAVDPTSATTDAGGLASTAWTLPHAAGNATATATVTSAAGSPVTFSATATAGTATQMAAFGGNNQLATVGEALPAPFQVAVKDQFGNAVAGTSVAWAVTAGGGTIAPPSSTTSANGVAAAVLTLGPAVGANTATATVPDLTGSPVIFTATGQDIPTTSDVSVGNDFFQPSAIKVAAGTTVTWTWGAGALSHSVQSLGTPSFLSSTIMTGGGSSYSVTFNTPGTYQYDCAVHGTAMSGRVIVE
ncbi:MAG TPA: Ig-like domain-containing protein [Gemmatimonadales bacterium]|nr:Ig-like domain-containing protein [Gemmatimonadales bacterium]